MAYVRSFSQAKDTGSRSRTEVDATYVIVSDKNRGTMVKIATYGSDARQSGPKSSQVFELDLAGAEALIAILRQAFPGLTPR